ncbi:hypothetical protein D9M71_551560 [compost metagenome]
MGRRRRLVHLLHSSRERLTLSLEARDECRKLVAQLGILLLQTLQPDGLPQPEPQQRTEQAAGDRLSRTRPDDEADQHEDPLHASNP